MRRSSGARVATTVRRTSPCLVTGLGAANGDDPRVFSKEEPARHAGGRTGAARPAAHGLACDRSSGREQHAIDVRGSLPSNCSSVILSGPGTGRTHRSISGR